MHRKLIDLSNDRVASILAVLLLVCAAADRLALPKPSDAERYHELVRVVAQSLPLRVGDWTSQDVPVPTEAVEELRPNVMISRRYLNSANGMSATLLLVQCRDVRDLAPHYPPVCYPGRGLTLTTKTAMTLSPGDMNIHSTRYTFESSTYQRGGILQVDNFMILPDGGFQADMQGMERRIGANQRYFGAAQVQIVHVNGESEEDQSVVSEELLKIYEPLIKTISDGARK